ncbi:MAG: heavy metal sensor histidine kinase [Betaproteobacteria bacterium]|nr:heavy metal sensor histidine kinase [Betaproteobacteria bacterium]
MFSRSADAPAGVAHWRSLLGGQSIAAHIAQLHVLSGVAVVTIMVGFVYWVEIEALPWDDVQFLTDKVQQLRLAMRHDGDDGSHLAHEVEVQGGIHAHGQHYIFYSRVLDEQGRVLLETPGMENILGTVPFPQPERTTGFPQHAERLQTPQGRSYLLTSAWEDGGGMNSARRMIQVAMDNTDDMNFIGHYRRTLLLAGLLGVLLSAAIGVFVARSGMRPLARIARVAEQISASRLDRRIEPERWPQELTVLATAFDGMLDRLEDSHSRLAQFSADLAHELRTPIHVLMGRLELALSKDREPREYRRILEPALEEFHALARMIDDLLFLARAENPKTQVERRWFDARQELEAVQSFYEALAEDQGVTLTCHGQAQLCGDSRLIRRAVTNLLSNALRHTPSGGQIVLSVEQAHDNAVLLKVSDTGCGIRREDLPRVCERLFCSNQGGTPRAEGAGLGLAIVKSIAELHGGTASVESHPGRGTTVVLRLPNPALAAAAA